MDDSLIDKAFDDWFYEWCAIKASEAVGPNSIEYDSLSEFLYEDEEERAIALEQFKREVGAGL